MLLPLDDCRQALQPTIRCLRSPALQSDCGIASTGRTSPPTRPGAREKAASPAFGLVVSFQIFANRARLSPPPALIVTAKLNGIDGVIHVGSVGEGAAFE